MYWSTIRMMGSLVCLGGEDEGAHAAEGGVLAGAGDFDFEHAGEVLGAGEDFVADLLVHGEGFAGDVGLVEGGLAGLDQAVGGDVVAGADADDVADLRGRRRRLLPRSRRGGGGGLWWG
jgi:hypothetical protein